MRKKRADIILISGTRIVKEIEPTVRAEWGGRVNFSSFTSQARGVAIFFKTELPIEIIEDSIYNDKSGNFTTLNVKYESFVINISCVYGPNEDNPLFYKDVILKEIELRQGTSDFSILGGDLNLVLSQEMDTFGYTNENNINARTTLLGGMESLGLIDIFRELNPDKKRYSWRQWGGNKKARLDYFLISATLLPFVQEADILPGICSDHSINILDIDFSKILQRAWLFQIQQFANQRN